jgi:hypothetical protein
MTAQGLQTALPASCNALINAAKKARLSENAAA